jgi:hypothetical protein
MRARHHCTRAKADSNEASTVGWDKLALASPGPPIWTFGFRSAKTRPFAERKATNVSTKYR